jgi:hypothetical protein
MEVTYIDHVMKLFYAAGFIEADGCFQLTNSGVGVRVTNKHLPTLEWFKGNFGGQVISKSSPVDCWEWNLHGSACIDFVKEIRPCLMMKLKEADILIQFGATVGSRGKRVSVETKQHRDDLREKLKEARKCR